MKEESIELSFQEGSSDKVYQAELKPEGAGWIVNFAYGRRGNSLTTGTKTKAPIPFDEAKKAYDKLVQSKSAKGYKVTGQVSSSINTVEDREDTGLRPQLLNEVDRDKDNIFADYIFHPDYCMQEKYDGRRRLLKDGKDDIIGSNKKGIKVALSEEIEKACHGIIGGIGTLDGEDMGEQIMIFDDLTDPKLPYYKRHKILTDKLEYNQHLIPVETAWTSETKKAMYDRLVKERAEGVVFKLIDAPYTAGRPASGGTQFKCKFYESASCIVNTVSDTKSSISVAVFDENQKAVPVGNVTVYPNQDMPKVGDIVEVKYLYFYPEGSLYQPVLLGVRDDVDHIECTLVKLKIKKDEGVHSSET